MANKLNQDKQNIDVMGTIYRHNITTEEINKLRRMIPGRKLNDEKVYENTTDDDIKFADLYRLYSLREKEKLAQYYFNKIEDKILKYLLRGKDVVKKL